MKCVECGGQKFEWARELDDKAKPTQRNVRCSACGEIYLANFEEKHEANKKRKSQK